MHIWGFQSLRYESRSKRMSHFKTVKTALFLLVYVTGLDTSGAPQRAPDYSADFPLVICLAPSRIFRITRCSHGRDPLSFPKLIRSLFTIAVSDLANARYQPNTVDERPLV